MPPTHRTGSPSELVPHFRCRKQYRKAPALIALPAAPGLLLGPATGPPFLNFRPWGFAPHSLLALIPPSRGANFFLLGAGRWAQGLLPLPFLPLFLRLGEQTFHCPAHCGASFGPDFCSSRSRGSRLKTDFIGFAGTRARTEPPDGPTLNERTGTRGAHSHLPGFGPFLTFLYLTLPYFTLPQLFPFVFSDADNTE